MRAYIVGLGLIGGSLAQAFRLRDQEGDVDVIGWDACATTRQQAIADGVIRAAIAPDDYADVQSKSDPDFELVFLALPPNALITEARTLIPKLRAGTVLIDLCGVKQPIHDALAPLAEQHNVIYIGGHPMAGREVYGYENARGTLFRGASMILCPADAGQDLLRRLSRLFSELGFAKTVLTTPDEHDRIIAYTSQLAHIVSSAYIGSPTALKHSGFSAGSFADMTRVARIKSDLWSELFLANRSPLIDEIEGLEKRLATFRQILESGDESALRRLLTEGNSRKEAIDLL